MEKFYFDDISLRPNIIKSNADLIIQIIVLPD